MARLLRSYGKAKVLNPLNLVNPPANLFLPTLGTHLQAVNRSSQSQRLRPRSTVLRPPLLVSPPLFLPTLIKPALYAVYRSTQSSRLRPLSTKLRPPVVINSAPNLFLPTSTTHLQAVNKARDAYKFRGKSQYTGINYSLLKTTFLPSITTRLVSVDNAVRDRRIFKNSTKLFPATVISAKPNIFLPTLGSHLTAIPSTRDRYKFRGKSQYLGIPYILLRKPPFLPTLGTHLQAVPRALNQKQKKPYSTKLMPPANIIAIKIFLPTLGHYFYAVRKSQELYLARQHSTKLSPPKVVNPYVPVLPSFYPNYDLPPDTLWKQNPTYLEGAVTYDDPNTLFDADIPFDGAITGNLTSVYPQASVLWENQDTEISTTLWTQNTAYLTGSVYYDDPNTLFDALIPFDGTEDLSSIYPTTDTIWEGNSNE